MTTGGRLSRRTIIGPGDDCALVTTASFLQLITIDSIVENVHFRVGWGTPEQIGMRALEVNLSDIAAMGGKPSFCVVNLAARQNLSLRYVEGLNRGLRRSALRAGVDLVGGNITSARELSITVALLGDTGAQVLRRDTAEPGDEIFVTGCVGDAALGWRILAGEIGARGSARAYLINRYLEPSARGEVGARLARLRPAPAAIDISDGLLQDLGHIMERSKVGAEIDAAAIPLSKAYRAVARDDLTRALSGGEDYELLFCAKPGYSARALSKRLGIAVTRIGAIVKGRKLRLVGATLPERAGFDQLRRQD